MVTTSPGFQPSSGQSQRTRAPKPLSKRALIHWKEQHVACSGNTGDCHCSLCFPVTHYVCDFIVGGCVCLLRPFPPFSPYLSWPWKWNPVTKHQSIPNALCHVILPMEPSRLSQRLLNFFLKGLNPSKLLNPYRLQPQSGRVPNPLSGELVGWFKSDSGGLHSSSLSHWKITYCMFSEKLSDCILLPWRWHSDEWISSGLLRYWQCPADPTTEELQWKSQNSSDDLPARTEINLLVFSSGLSATWQDMSEVVWASRSVEHRHAEIREKPKSTSSERCQARTVFSQNGTHNI